MTEEADETDEATPRTVRVTYDQVSAARALIHLRGGEDKVDTETRIIAHATPITREQAQAQQAAADTERRAS